MGRIGANGAVTSGWGPAMPWIIRLRVYETRVPAVMKSGSISIDVIRDRHGHDVGDFPAEDQVAKDCHPDEGPTEGRPMEGTRLLIVEDDRITCKLLRLIFAEMGLDVITAHTVADGLALLGTRPDYL